MLQPTFDNLDCNTTTQANTKTKAYLDLKILSRSRPIHGVDRPGLEFRDQESC